MINAAQKTVLAPRSWQRRSELRITKGAAQGDNAANQPKHEDHPAMLDVQELKTQTGEHPGANHVGDNQRDRRSLTK